MDMIRIMGTCTGAVNMWCDQCPWWLRDQVRTLAHMIELAQQHVAEQHGIRAENRGNESVSREIRLPSIGEA